MDIKEESPLVPEAFEKYYPIKLLLKSEASLFLIFFLNFSMSIQYYTLVTLIPIYFTDEHGLSDLLSGVIFGCFGVTLGVTSIFITNYFEKTSSKSALVVSSIIGFCGFALMTFQNLYSSLIAVILFQSTSCAMSWPFTECGVKMYSKSQIIHLSSSIYFMCNYLAGIFTGIYIDLLWYFIDDSKVFYYVVWGTGMAVCGFSCAIAFCLRNTKDEEEVCEDGEEIENENEVKSTFYRFLVLIGLMILMRSACFGHIDTTFPKYIMRVLGDDNAHFGAMLAVHSVTIMTGIFCFTALTVYYKNYDLITMGGAIGAFSTAILIFWEGYAAFTLAIIGISLGEALWVPRLLDYTYEIAPKGHLKLFLALSNCPFYFGMIITGIVSGLLLEEYCPEDGEQQCNMIWVVVFFSSIFIPFILFIFRSYIQDPKALQKKL